MAVSKGVIPVSKCHTCFKKWCESGMNFLKQVWTFFYNFETAMTPFETAIRFFQKQLCVSIKNSYGIFSKQVSNFFEQPSFILWTGIKFFWTAIFHFMNSYVSFYKQGYFFLRTAMPNLMNKYRNCFEQASMVEMIVKHGKLFIYDKSVM